MTLWQVLVSGQPLTPFLDVLPGHSPEELALLHGEARAALRALGREPHGEAPVDRVESWAESARLLSHATLPMGAEGPRKAIEREFAAALEMIRVSEEKQRVRRDGRNLVRLRSRAAVVRR